MGLPEKIPKQHLMGMLHVYHDADGLDIFNPNAPYAQARMTIVNGGTFLRVNDGAPRHFTIEVQKHLDKLKTILILGG
jgi:hypothetical protein